MKLSPTSFHGRKSIIQFNIFIGGAMVAFIVNSGIFSFQYRSMYLALALKQLVLTITGDLRTQWTLKRCLQCAIEAMNDVGVEFYTSFAMLSRWHRKFTRHRFYFCKAPEAKLCVPISLSTILTQWNAFLKKDGVANIKDLRVKMMLDFVHHELNIR